MKLLLDTHVLLWWFFGDKRLSPRIGQVIADPDNEIIVSSACAWEISTKHRIGKLSAGQEIVDNLPRLLARQRINQLPISTEHALLAGSFDVVHRDPFDRMLAAQSQLEEIPLATSDQAFKQFDIEIAW